MSFDSYSLIPAHVRNSDTSGAYRMVCDALNNVYRQHQDLIDQLPDIRSPRFGNQAIFEAWKGDKRLRGLQFFPDTAKSTLFTDLSNQYRLKGTTRSAEAVARLLGFRVSFLHLWGTLAFPDPHWIQNPKNDPYFGTEPSILPGQTEPTYPLIGYGEDPETFCDDWETLNPGEACPWGQLNESFLKYRDSHVVAPVLDISNQFIEIPNDTDLGNFDSSIPGGLRAWIQGFRKEVYVVQYDSNDPYRFIVIGKASDQSPSGGIETPPGDVQGLGYRVHVFYEFRVFPSNFFDASLVFPPEIGQSLLEREALLSDEEIEEIKAGNLTQAELETIFERTFWSLFFIIEDFTPVKAVPRKLQKNWISQFFSARVWRDLTDNEHHAIQSDSEKVPRNWLVGDGVRFQEAYMTIAETAALPPAEFSSGEWFIDVTLQNIVSRQVIYSQGNFNSGALVYVVNGRLVFGLWSENWGPFYYLHDVETGGRVSLRAVLDSGELQFYIDQALVETFPTAGTMKPSSTDGKFAILGRSFGEERFSGGVLQGSFYFRGVYHSLSHEADGNLLFHFDASIKDLRSFIMREGIYLSVVSQDAADALVQQDYESWLADPETSLCNLEEFIPPGESAEGDDLLDPTDISIAQTCEPAEVGPGETLTLTVDVTNNGEIGAINASIETAVTRVDGLGLTVVDADGASTAVSSGGGETTTTFSKDLGLLTPGESAQLVFVLKMPDEPDPGSYDIDTQSTVVADNVPDPVVSDVCTAALVYPATTLSLSKSGDETTVHRPGDPITYNLVLENTGSVDADNVVVVDTVDTPPEVDVGVSSQGDFDSAVVNGDQIVLTKNIASLAPGTPLNLSYTLEVLDGPEDNNEYTVTNGATANADNVDTPADSESLEVKVAGDEAVTIETSWSFQDEGYYLFTDTSDQNSNQHDRSLRTFYTDPVDGPDGKGSPWSFTQANQLGIRLDFEDDNSCHLSALDNDTSKVSGGSGDNLMPTSGGFAPPRSHHGVFNPNVDHADATEAEDPQEGEAILIVKANKNVRIRFNFSGLGERAHPTDASDWTQSAPGVFEEMRLYAEDLGIDPDLQNLPSPGSKDSPNVEEDWIGWARAPGGSGDTGDPADCRAGMAPIVTHQDSVGDGSFPNTHDLTSGRTYRFRVYCTTRDCWYHIGAHYQFTVEFEEIV